MRVQRLLLPEKLTDSKGIGEITIVDHAKRRMEFLWKDLNVLHGLAPPLSGAKLFIRGAPAQGRMAAIKGNQAAHVNFLSGLQTNFEELMQNKVVVPKNKTRKVIVRLTLPQESCGKIKDVFDVSRNYGARRQATHEFEPDVNIVDGGMENALRNKKILLVIKKTFQGKMEVEDAFELIKTKVANYFKKAVDMIPSVREKILRYYVLQDKLSVINRKDCATFTYKETKNKQKLQRAINSIVKSLKSGNTPGCGRLNPKQYKSRLEKLIRWKEICQKQYIGTIEKIDMIRLNLKEKRRMLAFHGAL